MHYYLRPSITASCGLASRPTCTGTGWPSQAVFNTHGLMTHTSFLVWQRAATNHCMQKTWCMHTDLSSHLFVGAFVSPHVVRCKCRHTCSITADTGFSFKVDCAQLLPAMPRRRNAAAARQSPSGHASGAAQKQKSRAPPHYQGYQLREITADEMARMCNPKWRDEALQEVPLLYAPNAHICVDISCRPCRVQRWICPPLARKFWQAARGSPLSEAVGMLLPPCSWCGYPTGQVCDFCPMTDMPAMQVCSRCDAVLGICRICYAVRGWTRTGSHQSCAACGKRPEDSLSRCEGCHLVRYCNPECQGKDWKVHKPFCKYLQSHKLRPPLLFNPPFSDPGVAPPA